MTEEIKPNPEQATTHEAQLAAENMVEGQEKVPKFEVPAAKETAFKAEPTGDPADYMDMAKEVSRTPVASGEVSDELVQKALELGQPGS